MSYYKDLLIENNVDVTDKEGIARLERQEFKNGIINRLADVTDYENEDLQWFCENAIPPKMNPRNENELYFIFFQDPTSGLHTNLKYTDRGVYITALLKAAKISEQSSYNIFYYPSSYDVTFSKREMASNEGAGLFTTLFFDLDDLENFGAVRTLEDIEIFMRENYQVDVRIFDAVCLSGHGLHFYKITQPIPAAVRTPIMEKWTTFLRSDRANIPPAHYYRLPQSTNHKPDKAPVKSRFFIINKTPNKDITAFENLEIGEEDLHAYKLNCDRRRAQKALVTRRKNLFHNLQKAEIDGVLAPKDRPAYEVLLFLSEKNEWDISPSDYQALIGNRLPAAHTVKPPKLPVTEDERKPLPDLPDDTEDRPTYEELLFLEELFFLYEKNEWDILPSDYQALIGNRLPAAYTVKPPKLPVTENERKPLPDLPDDTEDRTVPVTWDYHKIVFRSKETIAQNLCLELENYLFRHNGYLCHRKIFVMLYANYAKGFLDIDACTVKIKNFVADSFFPTAKKLIELAYQSEVRYTYTFKKIATLLEFDDDDYNASSVYFRYTYKEYQALYQKRYYRDRSDKANRDKEREAAISFLISNPSATYRRFQEEGYVLKRDTFFRYRKLIETGEPFTICGQTFNPPPILNCPGLIHPAKK